MTVATKEPQIRAPAVMPLYPSEREIAEAVLGPKRVAEWKALAQILERHGLPKISPLMGARYWPAVKSFLDRHNGVGNMIEPLADERF